MNTTTTTTAFNSATTYRAPYYPPRMEDCLGKNIMEGDRVIYSKGQYGYLYESVIKRFTDKSVIFEDGYYITFNNLKKIRKI